MKHTIIIFGADGQLGADLAKIFSHSHEVISCVRSDVDITNEKSVLRAVTAHAPSLVINCAAFTKVDENETKAAESFSVNAIGALYVSRATASFGVPAMLISTDYIFDGSKESFSETDSPHPLNVYGASKYAGELLTSLANPKTYIVRTSALFGAHASAKGYNFVTKMLDLAKTGDPIQVVNDQYTCPTYTVDLAGKIHELVTRAVPPGIYHITNQESCSWYAFALEIFKQTHKNPTIIPITTEQLPNRIRRPLHSVLENKALRDNGIALLPHWQDALSRYLQEIA